jgi:hypothetical protein
MRDTSSWLFMARDILRITGFFLAMPLSFFFPEFFLFD